MAALRCAGGVVGLLLLVCLAGAARAQSLDGYFPAGVPGFGVMPGVTVLSRARPECAPSGIRVGGFLLHPSLEEDFGYDSNVLGGPGAAGSCELGTHPALGAGSDWSGGAVGGVVGLDDTRYLDAPRQSRTDGTVAFGGALAVGGTSSRWRWRIWRCTRIPPRWMPCRRIRRSRSRWTMGGQATRWCWIAWR